MLDTLSSGSTTAESVSQQWKPIRPRTDSHLFHHYQKSLQEQSPASTAASSPASVQPSFSFDQPLSPVSTPDTVISHILPTTSEDIVKPAESPSKVADTASSKNQNCHKCNRPLKGGGPRIRLPGNNDQMYIWYHYNCLRCPACNSHFTEKQFVRVGQDVYHPKVKNEGKKTYMDVSSTLKLVFSVPPCHVASFECFNRRVYKQSKSLCTENILWCLSRTNHDCKVC